MLIAESSPQAARHVQHPSYIPLIIKSPSGMLTTFYDISHRTPFINQTNWASRRFVGGWVQFLNNGR